MCSPRGVFSSDVYFPVQNGLFVSVALCRNELKERVQREREELKARCILKKHVKNVNSMPIYLDAIIHRRRKELSLLFVLDPLAHSHKMR